MDAEAEELWDELSVFTVDDNTDEELESDEDRLDCVLLLDEDGLVSDGPLTGYIVSETEIDSVVTFPTGQLVTVGAQDVTV